jgi:hypothetical protein
VGAPAGASAWAGTLGAAGSAMVPALWAEEALGVMPVLSAAGTLAAVAQFAQYMLMVGKYMKGSNLRVYHRNRARMLRDDRIRVSAMIIVTGVRTKAANSTSMVVLCVTLILPIQRTQMDDRDRGTLVLLINIDICRTTQRTHEVAIGANPPNRFHEIETPREWVTCCQIAINTRARRHSFAFRHRRGMAACGASDPHSSC